MKITRLSQTGMGFPDRSLADDEGNTKEEESRAGVPGELVSYQISCVLVHLIFCCT